MYLFINRISACQRTTKNQTHLSGMPDGNSQLSTYYYQNINSCYHLIACAVTSELNTDLHVNPMNCTHMSLQVTLLAQHTVANGALGCALMESHMIIARILTAERLATYFTRVYTCLVFKSFWLW